MKNYCIQQLKIALIIFKHYIIVFMNLYHESQKHKKENILIINLKDLLILLWR